MKKTGGRKSRKTLPLSGLCHEILVSGHNTATLIKLNRFHETCCSREDLHVKSSQWLLGHNEGISFASKGTNRNGSEIERVKQRKTEIVFFYSIHKYVRWIFCMRNERETIFSTLIRFLGNILGFSNYELETRRTFFEILQKPDWFDFWCKATLLLMTTLFYSSNLNSLW